MKSKGTKETQGINPDAAALSRKLDAALAFTASDVQPCPYERHRGRDWRLVTEHGRGPLVCGVCHPPAEGLRRHGQIETEGSTE